MLLTVEYREKGVKLCEITITVRLLSSKDDKAAPRSAIHDNVELNRCFVL